MGHKREKVETSYSTSMRVKKGRKGDDCFAVCQPAQGQTGREGSL